MDFQDWTSMINISFQFLILAITVFTFWGIIKLVLISKKIEKLKSKYFNQLVHNVIVVRLHYFHLMEDNNFLDKFKKAIPEIVTIFGREAVQRDYEVLKNNIIAKRKTIGKFIWLLVILFIALLVALVGLLFKDFAFYGNGFCIFLFVDIVISTILLFFIKFIA